MLKEFHSRWTELTLLIMAAAVFTITLVSLELSQGNELTTEILWIIGGFLGVLIGAHIVLCFLAPHSDQLMLPIVAVLNGIGLLMLARIDIAQETTLASRQVMWTIVGLVLFAAVLIIVRDHKVFTRFSYLLGVVGIVLLALPLVFLSSLLFGYMFSKILLLLFFAMLLVQKRSLFTVAGYRFLGISLPRLRDLAPILIVWAIAIVIMGVSNDFGPALLLFSTVLGMLFMATGRVSWLLIGIILVAVGATGIYMISDKIQDRFSNFLDPLANYDNTGYQLSQALFGMSTGGITGSGLGNGYPELVPVAHSDFILAAIGEEFGLIGLSAVLILFALLVSRGFNTAMRVRDSYGKLVAGGLSLTVAIQVFVVTGGISALLPMTGLTTPFISAGGSALMANYILLAILLRISNTARRPLAEIAAPEDNAEVAEVRS